jgi:hypothetical protein
MGAFTTRLERRRSVCVVLLPLAGLVFGCRRRTPEGAVPCAHDRDCPRAMVCENRRGRSICIRHFETAADLWDHVDDLDGLDVEVDGVALSPAHHWRCHSKLCLDHVDQLPRDIDVPCVACNACRGALIPEGSEFRFMIVSGHEPLECTTDDCGNELKCPPELVGYYRLVGQVLRCGDACHALTSVKLSQIWP